MGKTSQMSAEQIQKALEAEIISPEQADAMRSSLKNTLQNAPQGHNSVATPLETSQIGNEENLRFLRSFSDVFIAIGLIILGFGAAGLVRLVGGGVVNIVAALACFLFALYFGRKLRAHLPTLILSLAFLFFTQAGAQYLFGGSGIIAASVTLFAMAVFYVFIRLPFCIALIAVSVLYLVFALLRYIVPSLLVNQTGAVLMVCGFIIFCLALFYDTKDFHRQTRFSDNAFWLHFLAAPLMIHGLAIGAIRGKVETLFGVVPIITINQGEAALILIAVGLTILVGLAINRRALIVSSLGYAAVALAYLVYGTGLGLSAVFVATLILLGASIVLLGAVWHNLRNLLIRILPKWKVFPPPFPSVRTR
jgi:hypothetical protein